MSLPLRRITQDIASLSWREYDSDKISPVLPDAISKARYIGGSLTTTTDTNDAHTPRLQREPLRPSHREATTCVADVGILFLLLAWITDEEQ